MLPNNSATKTAILLQPQQILTDQVIMASLHINKVGKGIDYTVRRLDSTELRKFHPQLDKDGRDVMNWFSKEGIAYYKAELEKSIPKSKIGADKDIFIKTSLIRRLHDLMLKLKPFAPQVKWYHKIRKDKNSYTTAPCRFNDTKPQISFEVVKNEHGLQLETHVNINGTTSLLPTFNRYHFLLEQQNEYFLLSHRDYQILEWLQEQRPEQYAHQPQELAQHILSRLEADYIVQRNNHFGSEVIDSLPTKRIMLSEISNSFLVLTPQWLYDGFIIEGPWKEKVEIIKEGMAYHVQRNKEAEKEFMDFLEALHPNFAKQLNGYFYLSFADAQKKQWFLKVYHKLLELDIQVIGMDMLQHFRYSSNKVHTDVSIKEEENDKLLLTMKVCFGEEEIPLNELQKILLAGQRAVLLKDGSLGILGDEWLQQYSTILKHGKVNKKTILVARWMALSEQQSSDDTLVLKSTLKEEWWQKWAQWQEGKTSLYSIPSLVTIESLRPYQQKGYEWMRLLSEAGGSACLADDMGLGKTLQTICFMASRLELNPSAKHMVVCPSSLIYNWQQELQKFTPGIKTLVYHGGNRNAALLAEDGGQIIITSYGTMRSDVEIMSSIIFDTIVVDESHNIKNPAALTTRAINQLQSITRVALSGTPVMNNTFDLYAQLSFLLPGMFGSREFFKREYADAIDRDRDPEKIKALQKLTGPFILRRTKEQVATDLPEKTESILWCEMGSDQRMAYDSIKENIRNSIFLEIKDKGLNAGKLSVLHGVMKLRQVCNSCELVEDEDVFTYDSIKTQMLIEELNNITGSHKALVFSQFTKMLDLLERDLTQHNIPFCRLDGSTKIADRQTLVNEFNAEESTAKVFLISLKAGNAGLNLTSADYVFLFDPWWNKAVEQQAIDRTHRIGQTKNVFAYKMVCKGTVEEKIIMLQQRKSKLSEELIGGEDGFVKGLTEEDVEFLFS